MGFADVLIDFWPRLLHGLGLTLLLTGVSAALAGAISLPLAIFRTNAGAAAQFPLRLYISFMRGTPLLGQLFLIYYGSGQFRPALQSVGLWTFFRDPMNCAILAFTLNSIAYQIEILRGGLMGVPSGQVEAAKAIGMSWLQSYRRVILPPCLPSRPLATRSSEVSRFACNISSLIKDQNIPNADYPSIVGAVIYLIMPRCSYVWRCSKNA
jgi:His/Glu/Gln/Arg/opine family amino acid ABC transporter permease subunit